MSDFYADLLSKFEAVPLPYEYVNVPRANEPQAHHDIPLYYFVNKVITNLTRDAFKHAGFKSTTDERRWNASWGRQYLPNEYKRCECWQKVNHFAGAFLMGRKDNLHLRMKELYSRRPELDRFYPISYLLPDEENELLENWAKHPLWIFKPSASSRGRGISLCKSSEMCKCDKGIYQVYIHPPLLVKGRKFDIRLYALVTSVFPMKIYMHETGLARFCTHQYDINVMDDHSHLTNFSLNKDDASFKKCDDTVEDINNSKWSLAFFKQYIISCGINYDKLMSDIEAVSINTIISGMNEIRKYHSEHIKHRHTSYEMYGLDIMIDEGLRPHLIEINISPSMSGQDSLLDYDLKYPLMLDLLHMARIVKCNVNSPITCPAIKKIDDLCIPQSLTGWDNPSFGDYVMIRDFVEEQSRLRGFRHVFPVPETMDNFLPSFEALHYRDEMFQKWMKMDNSQRLAVLAQKWNDNYLEPMKNLMI